ncbi:MAG: hypothetical protein JXR76_29405 [Deltaproteobacteria bacterium]|nr:hypothetical protein [Deltaproteobacteria bacterium]
MLLFSIVLFAGARMLMADTFTDWDEELYLIVARGWKNGLLPYQDIFDHKPPFVYLVYYLSSFGGKTMWLVRLIIALGLFYAVFTTSRCLKKLFSMNDSELLVFISLVVAALSFRGGITANTESLYIPALFIAFGQLHQKRIMTAAIAGAFALSIKYTTMFDLLGIAITYWVWHRPHRVCAAHCIRFLLLSFCFAGLQYLIFGLYFFSQNVSLFNHIVRDNLIHSGDRVSLVSPRLFYSLRFPVYLTLIPFVAWFLSKRKVLHGNFVVGAIVWGGLVLVQAMLTGQYYPHYFLPFVLPAIISVTNIRLSRAAIAVAAVFLLLVSVWTIWDSLKYQQSFKRKAEEVIVYCPLLRDGHYVLDDISLYRLCGVSRFDKYVFPPFYRIEHYASLSNSGGLASLRSKVETGVLPGIVFISAKTSLPEPLKKLPNSKVVPMKLSSF